MFTCHKDTTYTRHDATYEVPRAGTPLKHWGRMLSFRNWTVFIYNYAMHFKLQCPTSCAYCFYRGKNWCIAWWIPVKSSFLPTELDYSPKLLISWIRKIQFTLKTNVIFVVRPSKVILGDVLVTFGEFLLARNSLDYICFRYLTVARETLVHVSEM